MQVRGGDARALAFLADDLVGARARVLVRAVDGARAQRRWST